MPSTTKQPSVTPTSQCDCDLDLKPYPNLTSNPFLSIIILLKDIVNPNSTLPNFSILLNYPILLNHDEIINKDQIFNRKKNSSKFSILLKLPNSSKP
jgi:hypothetical protein